MSMALPYVPLLSFISSVVQSFRRLRLTVHRAYFAGSAEEHFFVTATNLSRARDLEVTHVWLESEQPIPVLQHARPLPKRLRPDESWSTWLPIAAVPSTALARAPYLFRARLSSGKVVQSRPSRGVPPVGQLAGGPITPSSTEPRSFLPPGSRPGS
jgi:hypothetical protein